MSDPVLLPATIHAVTVHADGALVQRRAALGGVAGQPGLVRIPGLPLAAAGRPVRARIRDGGAEVLSCRLVTVAASGGEGDDRPLEAAVEAAETANLAAEQHVDALSARLSALETLDPPARPDGAKGQPPPASPAAARFDLLRFRDQETARLNGELAAARLAAEQAAERLAAAQAKLAEATAAREARTGEVRLAADLQLRWPASGEPGWVELDYVVPGARWAPSYVLRFDRELGQVAIQLRGLVAQRTGEDWSGVRIACATTPLRTWCELPRLASRRIGRAQPAPPSGWRPAPAGADGLFADWDRFAAALPKVLAAPAPSFGRPSKPRPPMAAPCAAAPPPECEESSKLADECLSGPPPCPSPAPSVSASMDAAVYKEKKRERSLPMAAKSSSIAPGALRRNIAPAPGGAADLASALAESDDDQSESLDQEPAGLSPGADLLDFAALRLSDSDGPGRGRPRPGGGLGQDPRWSQAFAAANARCTSIAAPPAGHQPVGSAQAAVRWEGVLPVDVPADGGWHVVPLASADGAVRLSLVVVPRESRTAFRSAAVGNPFDRPLIAGPADVYVGADFLLATRLPDIAPGATAAIGLGVEQTLAVARNATFAEETAGMLGGSLHLKHAVRIELHNKSRRPAVVEVRERLPQPDDGVEHCTVKQLAVDPPWEEWRPMESSLPGGRHWVLTLAPGEQRKLAYDYRIEIPAKNELTGGNRREA